MAPSTLVFAPPGTGADAETTVVLQPNFDRNGLIAAVVTDATTGQVLMLAWMNAAALAETLQTRVAHFWSRSRQRLWKKGEESGNLLDVIEARIDCDQDALWLKVHVRGNGIACHTGAVSCFYRTVELAPSTGTVALRHNEK